MQISKAIRQVMKEKSVSLLTMAKAIGKQRGNDISARLTNPNMSFDKAVEMLDVLGRDDRQDGDAAACMGGAQRRCIRDADAK